MWAAVTLDPARAPRTPSPAWCAALAIAAGLLVLLGWAADVEPLKRILPGLVAMNPATAVLFVLAGASLWLQRPRAAGGMTEHARAQHRIARLLAGLVVVTAALILGDALLGWGPGVDQWLFADKLAGAGGGQPNRMAPNTAFNFLLMGLALLALDVTTRRGRRPSELLASGVFLVALLALAGYAYRVPGFIGLAKFIPMALPTALVFLTLALGVFVARPNAGMMAVIASPSLGGMMARRLFPSMVLTILALGWLRLEGQRRGLYGLELGLALYTLANITMFGALVWWGARLLHRLEAERERVATVRDQALALNRLIMDNSLDVICAIDGEGRFVEVSAASQQLWGYAPSELVGRAYADLVHPDDAAKTAKVAAEVTAGQPTADFSNRYLRKDGSPIDIDWSAIWSEPDAMMFCVARDATRRKQAEELLRQSQAQTLAIIATASDAFVAIDRSGLIIDWNARAESIFGWPRAEALGRLLSQTIIPHQHRQAHNRGLDHYLATGEGPVLNKPIEITALHRDGHEFPVELTIWPVTIGVSTTFNAFVRDITERRQAEEISAKFSAIIASSDDAIVSKTLEGIITSWNPAAEQMFGYTMQEAVGKPMAMLIPPERLDEEPQILARIGRGERIEHFETVRVRKDGKQINVSATISPIRDGSGRIIGASKIARDITERRQAEQAIQTLNAELTANAVELQQSNRELEAFSYFVSHDLRAPLRHIDGYARMLQEDAGDQLDAEMRRYLDAVGDSARQMGALIDGLLAFSKLGRKPVERVDVDMGALLQRVAEELRLDGDPRVSIGPLPAALADPVLFKQVWINLLSNAIKYSAPRGDEARVEVSGERSGERVQYRICDNGVGFDMRYADKLFGVFQRLHSHDEFEGTGVGLAIVQRIVARHGGSIAADSQPGLGATFTFELPLGTDSPPDTAAMEAST
ncbi:hypothetical protein BH23PSE2_BH23PSE2_10790 [soil metagenome]